MHPYLHILIRVEDDGSLHALGAFTNKESQQAYQDALGLKDSQVRLDFYNGPFDENIQVIYAGHRRWNMTRFQLGGYFRTEGEAWTWVTQEGYVSVLRIDTTYEEEKQLEEEALKEYARLQKAWKLSSYEEIVEREGADKARANIMLRFYEDALESFKPKTSRDTRAIYLLFAMAIFLPLAVLYAMSQGPSYGENVDSVKWLPEYTSNISYYKSDQVHIYEFSISPDNFKKLMEGQGYQVRSILKPVSLSRYAAYIPNSTSSNFSDDEQITEEELIAWQSLINTRVEKGLYVTRDETVIAAYNYENGRAYVEDLEVDSY